MDQNPNSPAQNNLRAVHLVAKFADPMREDELDTIPAPLHSMGYHLFGFRKIGRITGDGHDERS